MKLDIRLSGGGYPVYIGALEDMGAAFEAAGLRGRAALVTDENVWRIHGERAKTALRCAGIEAHPVVVPAGEASKSLDTLKAVYKALHACGLRRDEPVITFGGGVPGDLGGFAAATYMRGVPFVQMPTTLLAQVDASVGGKVAVDLEEGKNLAGAFWQPRFVYIDTALLATLPTREFSAGMAEVVKHAAIRDTAMLDMLEGGAAVTGAMDEVIRRNVLCKAHFVERDERDTGERMMLNFGHTFGHAIEKYHNFEGITHGEAVAQGMMLAASAGEAMGVTPPHVGARLGALLRTYGLNTRTDAAVDALIPLMASDKKNTGDAVTLILLRDFGAPCVHRISPSQLRAVLR